MYVYFINGNDIFITYIINVTQIKLGIILITAAGQIIAILLVSFNYTADQLLKVRNEINN